MLDFMLGFICGVVLTGIIWWRVTDKRVFYAKSPLADEEKVIVQGIVTRPDNEKARKFNDPMYRAEKQAEILRRTAARR